MARPLLDILAYRFCILRSLSIRQSYFTFELSRVRVRVGGGEGRLLILIQKGVIQKEKRTQVSEPGVRKQGGTIMCVGGDLRLLVLLVA